MGVSVVDGRGMYGKSTSGEKEKTEILLTHNTNPSQSTTSPIFHQVHSDTHRYYRWAGDPARGSKSHLCTMLGVRGWTCPLRTMLG